MSKLHPLIKKQNGITLVELLATIVISSLIMALAYTILIQGFSTYQRVTAEAALRDEADLIMASIIKDVFLLNESEIVAKNECKSNIASSYLSITKKNSTTPYITGFIGGKIYIKNQVFNFSDSQIQIKSNTCENSSVNLIAETKNNTEYLIKFTLRTTKGKKTFDMDFENTIRVIPEIKEGS